MEVKFKKKIADKDLDEFVFAIYTNFTQKRSDSYVFDLTNVEYIGNQELLVLSAIFKLFYDSNIDFEVHFFKKGIPTSTINERIKRQIIQIWEVWQIWKIIDNDNYIKYFGIDGKSVNSLKKELNYYPSLAEIYTRHGITPFISLDYIHNYNQNDVQQIIAPIYKLNEIIVNLLQNDNCYHPFTSQSLSSIITEEFYLNFLDHSIESSFKGLNNMAFMSISFQGKIDEKRNSNEKIQQLKKLNFESENILEARNFYFDEISQKFKNTPHIQFSFLDFGAGIANTLRDYFQQINTDGPIEDSEILRYSFEYFSSRHPINPQINNDVFIPRGLFDCLTIVNRYQGLMIVRSNHGKILYDFSNPTDIKSGKTFSDKKFYFPGTLISIYIPAIDETFASLNSAIKPNINFSQIKPGNKRYVNFTTILSELSPNKLDIYDTLFKSLRKILLHHSEATLTFFSFENADFAEKRILKKTLYFLLTDYVINNHSNVVVINFLKDELLDEVEFEIFNLNKAFQDYKIHPLPIVQYNPINESIKIRWLGVFDEEDKNKLNDLLLEEYSIIFSDFKNPSKLTGQLNAFDKFGNLISNFPSRSQIIDFYDNQRNELYKNQLFELLKKHNCIREEHIDTLFLTSSNLYQKQYIDLTNLVNDAHDCAIVAKMLFESLQKKLPKSKYRYIGVTTSSQKILKSLESQKIISEYDYLILENYQTFENDANLLKIDVDYKYILISDVLATGKLTLKLNSKLKELGTQIWMVGALINTLDPESLMTKVLLRELNDKVTYLYKYKIEKFRKTHWKEGEILSKKIIRIDPFTNRPIISSIHDTNYERSVVFRSSIGYVRRTNSIFINNRFLDKVSVNDIKVGFIKYNNLIYPYYFETRNILKKMSGDDIEFIFKRIQNTNINTNHLHVFYPRKSGVEVIDLSKLRHVLKNQSIEAFEVDRYSTPVGWRFPHNTTNLASKIGNNICLLLDDGSCSGDSLIQMIDEIAFNSTKEILLLCFIGRVNDHKREFFSRLSHMKGKDRQVIPISIYFVTHWHIPTYDVEANPNIKESLWLEDLINLSNTPQNIKAIADKVLKAITPKNEHRYQEYKYLPKIKSNNIQERVVPKKEMLLVREELGKIIGYRLYKESFDFFDGFFKKYENKVYTKNRYKEIELLCATFIFEPYLYDKISSLIPDVVEQIEDFVRVMIFSNDKIYEKLTYRWNKKDIIHLFFVVFKNEKLIEILNNVENFDSLLKFTGPNDPALDYVLYKLLFYFPVKPQNFTEKKFDASFKKMISTIIENPEFQNKELIKFRHFILSLPSKNDFQSQIEVVKSIYITQDDPSYHDQKISFNHNVSLAITTITITRLLITNGNSIDNEKITLIRECWFEILNFVNPILSFSSSFKEFLVPYPYLRLINVIDSLRDSVGYNDEVILSLSKDFSDQEKLKNVVKNISKIQNDIGVNSIFYKLVIEQTSVLKKFFLAFQDGLSGIFPNVNIDLTDIEEKWLVNIPIFYMENVIRVELLNNLIKHCDKTSQFKAEILLPSPGTLVFKIKNRILKRDTVTKTGEGIKCLMLLGAFPPFGFTYQYRPTNNEFNQILTFKFSQ